VRAQEIREGTVKMSRKEAQCDADIVFRSSTISYNPKALSDNRLYVSMNSEKRARHKDGGHGTHDIINATWMTGGTVDLQYIADEYDIDTAVSKSTTTPRGGGMSSTWKALFVNGVTLPSLVAFLRPFHVFLNLSLIQAYGGYTVSTRPEMSSPILLCQCTLLLE
jgi:hypothetical protein